MSQKNRKNILSSYVNVNAPIINLFNELQLYTVKGWAALVEYKDPKIKGHLCRIAQYTELLLQHLQKLNKYNNYITDVYIRDMKAASMLHDIGKIGVDHDILYKKGSLTYGEFKQIKEHVRIGGHFVGTICREWGDNYGSLRNYLDLGKQVALYHHEHWDGKGYIHALKGERIPLSARVVAVADVYDALTSDRPYKHCWSHDRYRKEIMKHSGTHFDPEIVRAFSEAENEFSDIAQAA